MADPEIDPNTDPDVDPNTDPDVDPNTDPEYVPPTKEQWDAHQADLKRARGQAKKLREEKEAAKPPVTDPAVAGAEAEKWRGATARSEAKAALIAAGVDTDVAALAAQGIKPSQVVWDEDDDADVSEWVERLRVKKPGLFVVKTPSGRGTPKLNRGGGGAPKNDTGLSFGERVMKTSKATP